MFKKVSNWVQGIKHHFLSKTAQVEKECNEEQIRIRSRLKIEKEIMQAADNNPDIYDRLIHSMVVSGDMKKERVDRFKEDSQMKKAEVLTEFFKAASDKKLNKENLKLLEDMTK